VSTKRTSRTRYLGLSIAAISTLVVVSLPACAGPPVAVNPHDGGGIAIQDASTDEGDADAYDASDPFVRIDGQPFERIDAAAIADSAVGPE
jgi:hypothetical protein